MKKTVALPSGLRIGTAKLQGRKRSGFQNGRRFLCAAMVFLFLLFLGSPGWTLTVSGGIDVGEMDTFIASGNVNSGWQNEFDWVIETLEANGYPYDSEWTKFDLSKDNHPGSARQILGQGNESLFAIELTGAPAYYFLKTGNVKIGQEHFLFANTSHLGWAVFDLIGMGIDLKNWSLTKISHTGVLGGGGGDYPTAVPEPATMLLLGCGLIGLAGIARKIL